MSFNLALTSSPRHPGHLRRANVQSWGKVGPPKKNPKKTPKKPPSAVTLKILITVWSEPKRTRSGSWGCVWKPWQCRYNVAGFPSPWRQHVNIFCTRRTRSRRRRSCDSVRTAPVPPHRRRSFFPQQQLSLRLKWKGSHNLQGLLCWWIINKRAMRYFMAPWFKTELGWRPFDPTAVSQASTVKPNPGLLQCGARTRNGTHAHTRTHTGARFDSHTSAERDYPDFSVLRAVVRCQREM